MINLENDDIFIRYEKEILFYIINFNKQHLNSVDDDVFFTNYEDSELDWKYSNDIFKYLENFIPNIRKYFLNYSKLVKEIETYNIITNVKSSLRYLFKDYTNYQKYCNTQNFDKLCNVFHIKENILNYIESINYNYQDLVESDTLYIKRIPFVKELYDSININICFNIDDIEIVGIFNDEFHELQYKILNEYLSLIKQNKMAFDEINNIENLFYRYKFTCSNTFIKDLEKYQNKYLDKTIGEYFE